MTSFCPTPWPEDPTPMSEQYCEDCGLYKQGSRMIWGEGNPKASIMIILDNPGARENKEGNTFVCSTRATLQKGAYEVGFKEDDLYVTYLLKRRPKRAYDKDRTRQICMKHLANQLKVMQPKLIFCMGNVVVEHFFNEQNSDVKSLRGSIHSVDEFPTAVTYHPFAIRRRPNLWKSFLTDWKQVARYYQENLAP